jgi:tRNA(Ile2) C34 agmatinyltransferase TiaS
MTPDEFEALSQAEKDAAIAARRADTLHYGWCKRCQHRIEALGKAWPIRCPECNYGG